MIDLLCAIKFSNHVQILFVLMCFMRGFEGIFCPVRWKADENDQVNPYTLEKDSHPISSYNITPESHITATRIEEMIIN